MAKLFKASGEVLEVQPKNGRFFTMNELQNYVGGFIENVNSRMTDEILVVNEEGKLNHLAVNEKATEVFTGWFGHIDVIVGDAILCESCQLQ